MSDKTIPMVDDKTQRMDEKYLHRLVLTKSSLETQKDRYEIDLERRIGIGGESQVYLARRLSDGEEVAIKIHDTVADDPQSRRNRKAVLDFLTKNSDFTKTLMMPLWDYGHIEMLDRESGELFIRFLDVIPYCKDGELKHCDFFTLRDKIIPDILHGLNILHSNNLVHRDIKPTNIYLYKGFVLLADFGTTSQIMNAESHSKTQTRRGTPGYTAPEISDNYYVVASDYYSLGCTIATLYKGRHVYQNLIEAGNLEDITIAIRRKGLPLDCPEKDKSLQILVDALVMRDENMRAGYDAVKLWLSDPNTFAKKWRNTIHKGVEKTTLDFNFEGTKCDNIEELTEAIQKEWDKGKQYLYRGTFKAFFDVKDPTIANIAQDIVENKKTAKNQNLGLAMFLHYIYTTQKKDCPIFWCGETYNKLSDISKDIANETASEEKIIDMLKSRFLSWKFEMMTAGMQSKQDIIKRLKEIEDLTKQYGRLGYFYLMYCCSALISSQSEISTTDKEQYNQSPDYLFNKMIKDGCSFYEKAEHLIKDDMELAYLAFIGYKESVLELKKNLTGAFLNDESISDLLLIYKLFEGISKNKTIVREHFLSYGPLAYLYWFQQNLSLYKFNSPFSKEIEQNIKKIKIGKELNINDNFNGLLKIKRQLKEFFKIFQNNCILTQLGLSTDHDKNGITTHNSHAFFISEFYGLTVPIGYLKSLDNNNL